MRHILRLLLYSFLLLVIAAAGGAWALHRAMTRENFKEDIEQAASDYLQRRLTIESLQLNELFPPTISGTGVRILEQDSSELAYCPQIRLRFFLGSIPKFAVGIQELRFINPVVQFHRDQEGVLNIRKMVNDIRARPPERRERRVGKIFFNRFVIENGRLAAGEAGEYIVNGRGRLSYGRWTLRFPFTTELESTEKKGGQMTVEGAIGPETLVEMKAHDIPIRALAFQWPRFDTVDGLIDSTATYDSASTSGVRLILRGATTQVTLDASVGAGDDHPVNMVLLSSGTEVEQVVDWWRALAGADEAVFRATGKGTIDGRLASFAGPVFLSSATGSLSIVITDGVVWNLPVLMKTLSESNVKSLVKVVRGNHQEGVPFKTIRAQMDIQDGKASTREPIVLESDTMQLGFMGAINIVDRTIDGTIVINLVTLVDEIIQQIPVLRGILLGKRKSIVPFWFKVEGPIRAPHIKGQPVKTISAPVFNTLGHLLKLPGRLIDQTKGKD